MTFKFSVLSEEELKKQRPKLAEGDAEFEILHAEETISKTSGKPMVKFNLRLWDKNGMEGRLFDYVPDSMQWKIKSICASIGRLELYEKGEFEPKELIGHSGKCELRLEKDKSGKYEDQIKIKMYFPLSDNKAPSVPSAGKVGNDKFDDDLPF